MFLLTNLLSNVLRKVKLGKRTLLFGLTAPISRLPRLTPYFLLVRRHCDCQALLVLLLLLATVTQILDIRLVVDAACLLVSSLRLLHLFETHWRLRLRVHTLQIEGPVNVVVFNA